MPETPDTKFPRVGSRWNLRDPFVVVATWTSQAEGHPPVHRVSYTHREIEVSMPLERFLEYAALMEEATDTASAGAAREEEKA